MSRTHWIILVLLLMIPGAAGLCWGHLQRRAEAGRILHAAETVADAPSADEYLSMYDQWRQLTPAQIAENPWGHGQYGGPDIQKRLRQDQHLRLESDLPDLDAGLKSYPAQLAEVLYGANWSERLAEYRRTRETRSLVMTASTILSFAGGLFFFGGLVKYLIVRLIRNHSTTKSKDVLSARSRKKTKKQSKKARPRSDLDSDTEERTEEDAEEADETQDDSAEPGCEPVPNTGYFESVMSRPRRPEPSRNPYVAPVSEPASGKAVSVTESSGVLDKSSYFGWAMDPEEEDAPVSALMTTQPVTHGLSELTEEVSAIRQFAAAQQDQMRKLQDGYDWMIIRRFCMRVIRCIDNLDDRMGTLGGEDETMKGCLSDIRDELIFALESSGVEQFQPDLKMPFKGLEKYAEAVRQRVPATEASLAGAIAEIVRPGYHYLISDDDIKIVRCAQVKLYDTAEIVA